SRIGRAIVTAPPSSVDSRGPTPTLTGTVTTRQCEGRATGSSPTVRWVLGQTPFDPGHDVAGRDPGRVRDGPQDPHLQGRRVERRHSSGVEVVPVCDQIDAMAVDPLAGYYQRGVADH